jgi:hypothetical protein
VAFKKNIISRFAADIIENCFLYIGRHQLSYLFDVFVIFISQAKEKNDCCFQNIFFLYFVETFFVFTLFFARHEGGL